MSIALKEMSPKAKQAYGGLMSLAQKDGAMYKRTLICRTGDFDGAYGPITVTEEMLLGIANRYNKERAKPQNENDFAPILVDHTRLVDLIKGRVMADMEVGPWTDPDDGMKYSGLYATLRVDLPEAQEKVDSGQYAQVSINFDEETFEFYELSFVAVEAARRSIVLSNQTKGNSMELSKRLSTLAQKHQALAATVKKGHEKRQSRLSLAAKSVQTIEGEIKDLTGKIAATSLKMKTAQVKANMLSFVRAGKMSPDEMKKADMVALSKMDGGTLAILFSSYEARPVSPDLVQFGQGGDNEVKVKTTMTNDEFRKAAELQRSGKGTSLAAALDDVDDKSPEAKKLAEDKKAKEPVAMDHEEMKKILDEMDGHHKALIECHSKLAEAHKAYAEMAEDDKADEEKEKEHMSSEDGKE